MNDNHIYIIGGGLSGLSAAISLAQAGNTRITILEQGSNYAARLNSTNSDILCGLGGAGTLGGGKLCFPPASGKIWKKTKHLSSSYKQFKQQYFDSLIANADKNYIPLLRTDNSSIAQKNYNSELLLKGTMNHWVSELISMAISLGVTIRCHCTFLKFQYSNQGIVVDFVNEESYLEQQTATYLLLATGRTSVSLLNSAIPQKISFAPTPDLGIRLSLDRDQSLAFSAIGKDIKLKSCIGDFSLRTFCVCSGGDSVLIRKGKHQYYDGHFSEKTTEITNFGILARSPAYCGITVADDYLNAMQEYVDADMSLKDLIKYRKLLTRGNQYGPLFDAIIEFISQLQDVGYITQNPSTIPIMIPSVDRFNALIATDRDFETQLPGVFVIGDAAGISRGFVQAMWSGHCAAERIKQIMTSEFWNRRAM